MNRVSYSDIYEEFYLLGYSTCISTDYMALYPIRQNSLLKLIEDIFRKNIL